MIRTFRKPQNMLMLLTMLVLVFLLAGGASADAIEDEAHFNVERETVEKVSETVEVQTSDVAAVPLSSTTTCACGCRTSSGYEFQFVETSGTCQSLIGQTCGGNGYYVNCGPIS